MNIRTATPQDAAAILDIYAPYIEQTAITFEYDVPTVIVSKLRSTSRWGNMARA